MKPSPRALPVLAFALVASLAGLSAGCRKSESHAASGSPAFDVAASAPVSPPTQAAGGGDRAPARRAMLEVHAQVELEVTETAHAKSLVAKLADLARASGGYVAESRDDGSAVHMVVRLPPSALRDARATLAGQGSIVRESEQAVDVTDAVADLDARLRSARIEEGRILKILEERAGGIADVLAAERALADVRQRVERLETDQRLALGRVELATLDVTMRHPVAAAMEPSVGERLGEAARDGVAGAKLVTIGLATTGLRAGPTLVIFGALALAILLAVRRLRKVARNV